MERTLLSKGENRWEFGVLSNRIKITKKPTVFNMLRTLILHYDNAEKLLKNWEKSI